MITNKQKEKVLELRKLGKCVSEIKTLTNVPYTTIYRITKHIKYDKSIHPKYNLSQIDNDYFSEENLKLYPERFVIIGFIASDGCVSDTKSGQKILMFNICKKDKIILDIINQEICNNSRKLSFNKQNQSYLLSIPSNQICKDLIKFNIIPRKTNNYDLPKNLTNLELAYFLRGFIYGDGSIYQSKKSNHRGIFIISTLCFAKSLKNELEKRKIVNSCKYYDKGSNPNFKQIHITCINGDKLSEFIFFDDKMKLLPRKHKILSLRVILSP